MPPMNPGSSILSRTWISLQGAVPRRRNNSRGFTLVELMVAVGILALLLTILASMTTSVSRTIRQASAEMTSLTTARSATDLGQKISLATLNTYYGYNSASNPTRYIRLSDLQFIIQPNTRGAGMGQEIYFVSPLSFSTAQPVAGLQNLMNACGFFVQYNNNDTFRPSPTDQPKWRYRLMQGFERTENLQLFKTAPARWVTGSPGGGLPWLQTICNDSIVRTNVTPLADNVIALVLMPQDASGTVLTTDYKYDTARDTSLATQPVTENQLPPNIQMTLITISETSATRLDTNSSTEPAAIKDALNGRFVKTSDYQTDIEQLSKALTAKNISFRIFTSSIPMRESKWSGAGAGY
ncbi:MAG: prepilin-type N-terminal cleavage/methylation domain-containing protein [Candidatus Methylacidiphilales bacterium]|nr:prepilin-type N-terminal cleavage/methylation domain-containing protein [Candidatus Methylacidiphilales bacterium]